MTDPEAVLVDTDVFSLLFVRLGSSDTRIARWRERLTGRQVLISFQTRTESLVGALVDGWGERRMLELRVILDRTPTVGVDNVVIDAHVALSAECRRTGHALHDKFHTADRWVAACAIAKGVEPLAGDDIYAGTPGLGLLA